MINTDYKTMVSICDLAKTKSVSDFRSIQLQLIWSFGEVSKKVKNLFPFLVNFSRDLELVEDNILVNFVNKDMDFTGSLGERCQNFVVRYNILINKRVMVELKVPSKTKVQFCGSVDKGCMYVVLHHLNSSFKGSNMEIKTTIGIGSTVSIKLETSKSIVFDVQTLSNVMINCKLEAINCSLWDVFAKVWSNNGEDIRFVNSVGF